MKGSIKRRKQKRACKFTIFVTCPRGKRRGCSTSCTIFLPQGVKIKLTFALRAAVFEIFSNFQIFGHGILPLATVKGSKVSLFLLY